MSWLRLTASLAWITRAQAAGFDQVDPERLFCRRDPTESVVEAMIRNGLYHITVEMLDGIKGGNQGVMVVRAARG